MAAIIGEPCLTRSQSGSKDELCSVRMSPSLTPLTGSSQTSMWPQAPAPSHRPACKKDDCWWIMNGWTPGGGWRRRERASQTKKCRCAQMWTARKTHAPTRDIPQVRRLIGTRQAHPHGVRGPPRSMKEHLPHVPLIQTTAFCFCCVFVYAETGERRKKSAASTDPS